jgi:hypothetical protein
MDAAFLRSIIGDSAVTAAERLEALAALKKIGAPRPAARGESNNHIHTVYSFSPYTPAMAALRAFEAGLETAGSVDHDSVGAAVEMLESGAILGIGACVGFEIRVNFSGTPFAGRKLNNPDSVNLNYMIVQGIPRDRLGEADAFLKPLRERRNERNRAQTERASAIFRAAGLGPIDFDTDVLPLSMAREGGGVTERHILAALAKRILDAANDRSIAGYIDEVLHVGAPHRTAAQLEDPNNPHRLYDLVGLLKAEFLPRFFIQPDERECIPVGEATALARSIGAIPAYAYLGDVSESPTGDKLPAKFEDDILDELVPGLAAFGFQAIAYMPPRNTREQLARVQALAAKAGLLEISGVDINSSRQSFNCPELRLSEFAHLLDSTWALVGHERLSLRSRELGFFHPGNPLAGLPLPERVARYALAGRAFTEDPNADTEAILKIMRRK